PRSGRSTPASSKRTPARTGAAATADRTRAGHGGPAPTPASASTATRRRASPATNPATNGWAGRFAWTATTTTTRSSGTTSPPAWRRSACRPTRGRPRRAGSAPGVCEHGNPSACFARHEPGDERLGRPICLDCYDHDHQVIWNHFAAGLWHRTKQNAERYLAQLAKARGIPPVYVTTATGKLRRVPPVRLSHGKAAEFQV